MNTTGQMRISLQQYDILHACIPHNNTGATKTESEDLEHTYNITRMILQVLTSVLIPLYFQASQGFYRMHAPPQTDNASV